MAYETIVPNLNKSIPNSDVTMQDMEIIALPQNAGAAIDPLTYNAQAAVYYDDILAKQKLKKETPRRKNKSKPKINGINTKVKSLVPRTIEGMDFILGKKNDKKIIVMGIDLNKIGDSFKKKKVKR